MSSPVVLKTQTAPPPTSIRFRAFNDSFLTHPATGLDPNYSPNPTQPLIALEAEPLEKLQRCVDNTHLKALKTGKPASSIGCIFCNVSRLETIWKNDAGTLAVVVPPRYEEGFELHLLCIPITQPGRGHITNVAELNQSHLPLLYEMKSFASKVLGQVLVQNKMPLSSQFFLQFHVPPFNSIDHLHLHISIYPPEHLRYWLGSPLHESTKEQPLITDRHEIADKLARKNASVVIRAPEAHDWEHLLISIDQVIELLEDGHGVCSALREREVVGGVKECELLLATVPLIG